MPDEFRKVAESLLNDLALEQSSIVANSLMNRERGCFGGNSYQKELRFNPIEFLKSQLQNKNLVSWLDICCGRGRALIEAAFSFAEAGLEDRVNMVGIDLVAIFDYKPQDFEFLSLRETSVNAWEPLTHFDLITCVHGLHYIGDKLRLIVKASSWLEDEGLFLANLDPDNLRLYGEKNSGKKIMRALRQYGVEYDSGSHLIRCRGRRRLKLGYEYLGADDCAGPNYTAQSAVDSFYRAKR